MGSLDLRCCDNLENSELYQKTSTNVFGIRENDTIKHGVYEYVVDKEEGVIKDIPDFIIEDLIFVPVENSQLPRVQRHHRPVLPIRHLARNHVPPHRKHHRPAPVQGTLVHRREMLAD